MLRFLGLPVESSAQATSIDQIIVIVHWLMLVMFVGWSARVDAFPGEPAAKDDVWTPGSRIPA